MRKPPPASPARKLPSIGPDGAEQKTTTDTDGRYAFDAVPDNATVRVSSPDYGSANEAVGERTEINMTMRPSFVSGQVTDAAGAPVAGARIAASNGSAGELLRTGWHIQVDRRD